MPWLSPSLVDSVSVSDSLVLAKSPELVPELSWLAMMMSPDGIMDSPSPVPVKEPLEWPDAMANAWPMVEPVARETVCDFPRVFEFARIALVFDLHVVVAVDHHVPDHDVEVLGVAIAEDAFNAGALHHGAVDLAGLVFLAELVEILVA